ncbi:MAG TPA: tRNA epoxyqueuosine(34) reductase QueG [Longimicrobiales bacterium]|nr:tRNA epoxyqueuosine(34) reductase QueG [Longimicrobiales bacterium]
MQGPDRPARSDDGALGTFIRREARRLGFEAVGIAPIRASDHGPALQDWLARGRHGSMEYLAREDAVEARLDPASRWPHLLSAVVVAHHYSGSYSGSYSGRPAAEAEPALDGLAEIARYARGRDYHRVVKKKLLALLGAIEAEIGRELPVARAYVDTGPLLERELARRAGIGWFGRNTMLIDPRRGSYFFLGSLLLPLELDYDEPFEADRCGTCSACVDACPTGALLGRDENGTPVMDATRCISYLTIENRGPIPDELRPAIGNRIYGCDICQEVCPWNSPKIVQATNEPDYLARVPGLSGADPDTGTHPHPHAGPSTDAPSLVELMRVPREEWDVWTRGSAMRRAGYVGFKRNVAVALGNWLAAVDRPPEDAVEALVGALEDDEPLIREHAAWALDQSS